MRHALGFVAATEGQQPRMFMDLGSGAGVPGLILALVWSGAHLVLLDASERKTTFLTAAARRLGLGPPRLQVVRDRAENVGRQHGWRGTFDLVVARGFGPPAVVAECAAPLLSVGGKLIVSEPPEGGHHRWPEDELGTLGLSAGTSVRHFHAWYRVLAQDTACPGPFPRRPGIPVKRPLF